MNNELIKRKSWWKRNWKWLVPVSAIILISIGIFFFSVMGGIATDFAQAYADTELYENAIKRVNGDETAHRLLGEIEPIDKLVILEGEVRYSNENKSVNSTVRINGTKERAKLDITANRIGEEWKYIKINVRIKNAQEKRHTIVISTAE
ncbi:MAG TPA: hypothetical protein ENH91_09835 [Leeuwenhoekiella sp.]|nr:hypothetical protein [Leeuwenhoekiella sp.]